MFHVARDWRTRHARYALAAGICEVCGAQVFPPRPVCAACMPGVRQAAAEAQARSAAQEAQPVRVVVIAQEEAVPVQTRPAAEGQAAEEGQGALAILKRRLDGEGQDGQILFSYE